MAENSEKPAKNPLDLSMGRFSEHRVLINKKVLADLTERARWSYGDQAWRGLWVSTITNHKPWSYGTRRGGATISGAAIAVLPWNRNRRPKVNA
jgi:hypothetical protein